MAAKVAKKSNRGSKPGERRGGRQKGTPNKITKSVKEAIEGAFHDLGGQKWLVQLGKSDPKAFSVLLGKLMPTQVTGADGGPIVTQAHLHLSNVSDADLAALIAGATDRAAS